MRIRTRYKILAVAESIFLGLVLLLKGFITKFTYPIAYLFYNDSYRTIHPPKNIFKWLLWVHYDYKQEPWGAKWYWNGYCKVEDIEKASKWTKFYCAYRWSAIRNAMYNVNYYYLSNYAEITHLEEGEFGTKKLRTIKGDRGSNLVWYLTSSGKVRFLYSKATDNWNFYFGWNTSFAGRFTVANKIYLFKNKDASKKDWCTAFPDTYFGKYIGDCCKEHDETCSTKKFYKCLSKKVNKISAIMITIGGALGCIFKYKKY
jgi:hypothetical protein